MTSQFVTITAEHAQVISSVNGSFQRFREQLNALFPEREWLVMQTIYALITGRNLLIFGLPGTAKSKFADTVFKAISGPGLNGESKEVFSIQLDSETTKSDLIGPPNIPLLEKGEWARVVSGYLPTATFAYLDEIFDALALLRGLNDILNEKMLVEGRQNIRVPLMTAIAATNRSPKEIEMMYPSLNLAAFNDRWLFVADVGYLKDGASLDRMIISFLTSLVMTASIKLTDLQKVVAIVNNTNQFPNQEFVQVYRRVLDEYRAKLLKAGKGTVTDRRIAWLTQIVEASAIFNGRTELAYDDIFAIVYGLCTSPESDEYKIFMEVATPIIEEAKKAYGDKTDEAVKQQLNRISKDVIAIEKIIKVQGWPTSQADVGAVLEQVRDLRTELQSIVPKLSTTTAVLEKLVKRIDKIKTDVTSRY